MTATEAFEKARKTPGGWTLDYPDGALEFRASSFVNGPDQADGQRFGTHYLYVRAISLDGRATQWEQTLRRSTTSMLITALEWGSIWTALSAVTGKIPTDLPALQPER